MRSPPKSRKAHCRACCFCLEPMLHDAGSAGSPEFQKLRKKKLVESALSWFKMLRASSMNQKYPYILRISENAKRVRFQVSVEKGLEIVVPKRFSASRCHRWSRRIASGSNGLSKNRRPSYPIIDNWIGNCATAADGCQDG